MSRKANVKMQHQSLPALLHKKWEMEQLKIVRDLGMGETKTKQFARAVQQLADKKSALLVFGNDVEQRMLRAVANIDRVIAVKSKDANTLDVLMHQYVLIDEKAIPELEKRFTPAH